MTYLHALDPSGNLVPLHVDADGHLIISGDITIGDITVSDVEIKNDSGNPVPVSGPLTDTQLRAADVKVTLDSEAVVLGAGTAAIGSTKPSGLTARGYEQITSLSTAAALTVPANTTVALIQAETQPIRWRDDGTDPTTTVGMTLAAGESLFFTGSLSAFRAIEITASATLNISYYG